MNRRTARKHAFNLVFQFPFHDNYDADAMSGFYFDDLKSATEQDKEDIARVAKGVCSGLTRIDALISGNLSGWEIDRINKADLAVLRLAIYEMIHEDDIPSRVSINEAVELAKTYGADDSFQFVNGILGKVFKILENENG